MENQQLCIDGGKRCSSVSEVMCVGLNCVFEVANKYKICSVSMTGESINIF